MASQGSGRDETRVQEQGNNTGSAKFPTVLYMLLEDLEATGRSHIAAFLPHGRAFQVYKMDDFVKSVLPHWFRQSKYTSFQRQLNIYGFKHITSGPDAHGYYHGKFLRGNMDLTREIVRLAKKGAVSRSANSPMPNFHEMSSLPEAQSRASGLATQRQLVQDTQPNYLTTDQALPPQLTTDQDLGGKQAEARLYPPGMSLADIVLHGFKGSSENCDALARTALATNGPSQSGSLFQSSLSLDMANRRGPLSAVRDSSHAANINPPLSQSDPYHSILQGLERPTENIAGATAHAGTGERARFQPELPSLYGHSSDWVAQNSAGRHRSDSFDPILRGLARSTTNERSFPTYESMSGYGSQADPPLRRSDPYLSILQGLEPFTGNSTGDLAHAGIGESNRLQLGLPRRPEESLEDRLVPWHDLGSTYRTGVLPTAGQSRFPPPESLAAHVDHPRDPWSLASLEFSTGGRSSRPATSLFQQSLDQPLRNPGSTYRPGTVDPILQGLLSTASQSRFPPPDSLAASAAHQRDPWSLASLELATGGPSGLPAASLFQQSLDQPILDNRVSNFAHANSATPRQQTLLQVSVPTEATGTTGRYNGDMFPLGPILGAPLRTSNEEIVYNDLIRSLLRSRTEQGDASFDLNALMAHLRSGQHR